MPDNLSLKALAFPLYFQSAFLSFVWGADDVLWMQLCKHLFLLLPALAIIACCWLTIPAALTIVFRHRRREYASSIFVTWWDLFRAIFAYWGGIFKFVLFFVGAIFGLARVMLFGIWLAVQDVVFAPLRMAKTISQEYVQPGVPWIAVVLTIFWSLLEAGIFSYVLTSLIIDVMSNLTGAEIGELIVQFPLFLVMFLLVLGSYAVLENFGIAVQQKDFPKILKFGIIEFLVMGFEVVFLYREFVDMLVPWFAQHSGGDFELGIFGTLAISGFAWLGIRGMTWFLFASAGTPTIMAIIRRTGLATGPAKTREGVRADFAYIGNALDKIKSEMDWIQNKGEELLGSFILPPLQIVAAVVNFCTLCINRNHLFYLPFKSFQDLIHAKSLLERVKQKDD